MDNKIILTLPILYKNNVELKYKDRLDELNCEINFSNIKNISIKKKELHRGEHRGEFTINLYNILIIFLKIIIKNDYNSYLDIIKDFKK